jgi:hypothetical protein
MCAAIADAAGCFDDEHPLPPPAAVRELSGVRYSSRLLGVTEHEGRAALHRRREIVGPGGRRERSDHTLELDRVSPDAVAAEAVGLGFRAEPHRLVAETDEYLGSTVVVLRAPT